MICTQVGSMIGWLQSSCDLSYILDFAEEDTGSQTTVAQTKGELEFIQKYKTYTNTFTFSDLSAILGPFVRLSWCRNSNQTGSSRCSSRAHRLCVPTRLSGFFNELTRDTWARKVDIVGFRHDLKRLHLLEVIHRRQKMCDDTSRRQS